MKPNAMKLKLLIAALAASVCLIPHAASETKPSGSAIAPAAEASKTLAVVNGIAVPQIFAHFVRQGRMSRNSPPEALTDESIREAVITAELMSQEAIRKGLADGPTLQAAIEFQKKELLSKALIEDFVRNHPIEESDVLAEYNKAKAKAGTTEYRPGHILLSSEKEANAAIAKLTTGKKKAKFEDLAKKESKDSSAGNGGDLGWVLPTNLVPEFAEAMVKLKAGEIGKKPVETKFGWHVIRMQEIRKLDFPEYDKLKERIASQMQQLQLRKYVVELRAGSRVE
jgi:peptidyl-prolyl cis-trans isomerase C